MLRLDGDIMACYSCLKSHKEIFCTHWNPDHDKGVIGSHRIGFLVLVNAELAVRRNPRCSNSQGKLLKVECGICPTCENFHDVELLKVVFKAFRLSADKTSTESNAIESQAPNRRSTLAEIVREHETLQQRKTRLKEDIIPIISSAKLSDCPNPISTPSPDTKASSRAPLDQNRSEAQTQIKPNVLKRVRKGKVHGGKRGYVSPITPIESSASQSPEQRVQAKQQYTRQPIPPMFFGHPASHSTSHFQVQHPESNIREL